MNIIELQNVSKTIRKKKIIKNVSLSIEKGQVFGLLGPNGAGKTTLLKMILGLLRTDNGKIVIAGHSIADDMQIIVKNVGALIESPAFYPYLSGWDNLRVFSLMSHANKNDIKEIVNVIGLEDQIEKKVSAYSLGMKQRLGLGIALLKNPQIIILDEPTNGLDPLGIAELRTYLHNISHKKGVTVIVSSHMLSEMNMLCDKFAIIANGKLVKVITSEDFLKEDSTKKFVFQVNDCLKGCAVLSPYYKVKIEEEMLKCIVNKDEVADIVKLLVNNEISVYGVQQEGNPLENLYFGAINQKGEMMNND